MSEMIFEMFSSPIPDFVIYVVKFVQSSSPYIGSPFIETPLIEVILFNIYSDVDNNKSCNHIYVNFYDIFIESCVL